VREKARNAIRTFLVSLQKLWPCVRGNGWSIPKFHEQLHIPDDIDHHGAPSNTHTGPTEHHHITFIKNLAKRTQKRQDKLDQQIAQHYKESVIIDTAYTSVMFHKQNTNTTNNVTNKSPTSVCKLGELTVYNKVNKDGIVTINYQVRYEKSTF